MDTLDDRLRDFESRLDEVEDRYRNRRIGRHRTARTIEEQLGAYEARLDALTREHRRRTDAILDTIWRRHSPMRQAWSSSTLSTPPAPSPFFAERISLGDEPILRELDAIFTEEFQLAHYFGHTRLRDLPTIYCETLSEFFQPYVEMLDVSAQTREEILQALVSEAEKHAQQGGGTWGIFWPGKGCYINGWLFAHGRAANARAALHNPDILPAILSTVAHEKLGHGFVSEYTTLGEEKKRLGTWRYDMARRFDIRMVDTPESVLLAEKEAVLYASSQLLEEGWATWIEHHVMVRLAQQARTEGHPFRPVPPARYTTSELWHALTHALDSTRDPGVQEALKALLDAVATLFVTEHVEVEALHRAVLAVHRYAEHVDPVIAPRLGQPLRYVIGYLLVRDLEARLGPLCVPYAIVIAANVAYNLRDVAAADLQRIVAQNPRLNVDSRLAQMRLLTLEQKDNVAELAARAHKELNLAWPKVLRT